MPPSGEGVNTAVLDAVDLSECLTDVQFPDLQTAIAAYERKMRTRGALLAQESLEGTESMYPSDALEQTIHDFTHVYNKPQ